MPPMSPLARRKPAKPRVSKHRRSRTGCLTCRKRKKRCDELKPSCYTCQRLSLVCEYPEPDEIDRVRTRRRVASKMDQPEAPAETKEEAAAKAAARAAAAIPANGYGENSPASQDEMLHVRPRDSSPLNAEPVAAATVLTASRPPAAPLVRSLDLELPAFEHVINDGLLNINDVSTGVGTGISTGVDTRVRTDGVMHGSPSTTNSIGENNRLVSVPAQVTRQSLITRQGCPGLQFDDMHRDQGVTYYSSNGDILSPPSLDHDADYFKYLTGQSLEIESFQAVKMADVTSPQVFSLSSPLSPFVSLSDVPPQIEGLIPGNLAKMENLFAPVPMSLFRELYPDLDALAFELLEYFQLQQTFLRRASPLKCFRSVALRFALQSRIIIYGNLAWTAWHRGKMDAAQSFFDKASEQLEHQPSMSKEELLSALLVLTCAKICSGDSRTWPSYLRWASSILKRHGGVASFMETETSRWLLLHFAYLDILSVTSTTTPKLLNTRDLEFIFQRPSSPDFSESIYICCEPVLLMIEQVNELITAMRVAQANDEDLDDLCTMAHRIEDSTWALKPPIEKISHLSASEKRLQIRQFDAFRLVAILHLYQGALCINASATPVQVLARRLLSAIDELIDTSIAGLLVFPLFILGVNSSGALMRQRLLTHFDNIFFRIHTRSVERVKNLLLKVWQLDNSGTRHVDWSKLIDQGFDFRCG